MTDYHTRAGGRANGKQILAACWSLLRQDRELLWLPVLAAVFGVLAAGIAFVPGFLIGRAVGGAQHHDWAYWAGIALSTFATSVVSIYFQAALVIGANQRADGGDPTLASVLSSTWQRRCAVLGWAALTTTVGMAIRVAEERLGVLGKVVGILGGIAWGLASFLAVPVLIAEDLGPIAALKRSGQLIRETWGTSVRTNVRFGLAQLAVAIPLAAVLITGVFVVSTEGPIALLIGVSLIAVGAIGLIVLAILANAVSTYARAMIYRYATGRPVAGLDPALFVGAFRPGRRRGGYRGTGVHGFGVN